jgi:hypothetical protein
MTARERAQAIDLGGSNSGCCEGQPHGICIVHLEIAEAIEAAVLEEREACAKVADDLQPKDNYLGGYSVQDLKRAAAESIAQAIRKRAQP